MKNFLRRLLSTFFGNDQVKTGLIFNSLLVIGKKGGESSLLKIIKEGELLRRVAIRSTILVNDCIDFKMV